MHARTQHHTEKGRGATHTLYTKTHIERDLKEIARDRRENITQPTHMHNYIHNVHTHTHYTMENNTHSDKEREGNK